MKRLNRLFRKISIPLNIANIVVGLLIGILHVYIPLATVSGLILGTAMAVSGATSIGISYYFTFQHTAENEASNHTPNAPPPSPKQKMRANLFLIFAVPMILLNAGASFFGMYTGIFLLALAFSAPFGPPMIALAVTLATILAVSTLINSWLQTHSLYEIIKYPKPKAVKKIDQSTQTESALLLTLIAPPNNINASLRTELFSVASDSVAKQPTCNNKAALIAGTASVVKQDDVLLSAPPTQSVPQHVAGWETDHHAEPLSFSNRKFT